MDVCIPTLKRYAGYLEEMKWLSKLHISKYCMPYSLDVDCPHHFWLGLPLLYILTTRYAWRHLKTRKSSFLYWTNFPWNCNHCPDFEILVATNHLPVRSEINKKIMPSVFRNILGSLVTCEIYINIVVTTVFVFKFLLKNLKKKTGWF